MSETFESIHYYVVGEGDESGESMRGPYSLEFAESSLQAGEKIIGKKKVADKVPQFLTGATKTEETEAAPDDAYADDQPADFEAYLALMAGDYGKMLKDVRNWGIGLIVWGIISLIASSYLDASWGLLLILVGLCSFFFSSASMFVVYSITLGWAAVSNVLSGEGGWIFFALVQAVLAFQTFRRFLFWRSLESELIAADQSQQEGLADVPARAAAWFPWVGCLFGPISLAGFFALLAGIIAYLAAIGDFQDTRAVDFAAGLLVDLAIIAFAVGLASLLQGYRHKGFSIVGMLSAGILLIIMVLFILLG